MQVEISVSQRSTQMSRWQHLRPVILCGGSGTRLWPLSRCDLPKQFLAVASEHSLLGETLERVAALEAGGPPLCIAAQSMGRRTRTALDQSGLGGTLILEPEPRNTAPAIAAAAYIAHRLDNEAILIVLPADHVIEDCNGFVQAVAMASDAAAAGQVIILGVRPREASAALGYIVPDHPVVGGVQRVTRFVEKPDALHAASLIAAGALWNAGIVVARADTIIAALDQHEPRVSAAVRKAVDNATRCEGDILLDRATFAAAPSISFDHAVLERHGNVWVAALEAGWRDVGTWNEVAALIASDENDNRIRGDVRLTGSSGNFLFSPGRLTVGLGLKDLLVIDTPDALLVSHKDQLGLLGDAVKAMIADARTETLVHRNTNAREGFAETGHSDMCAGTRRVGLKPGQSIVGCDITRDRHWIVIKGEARFSTNGTVKTLTRNQCHFVPAGTAHRIENPGTGRLELVELQVAQATAGTFDRDLH